jgi:hypothetical protein
MYLFTENVVARGFVVTQWPVCPAIMVTSVRTIRLTDWKWYSTRETSSFEIRFLPWVKFYVGQALGIRFENLVIWCYRQVAAKPKTKADGQEEQPLEVQPKLWHQLVGYAWVLSWWTDHMDLAMLPYLMTGLAAEEPLPFSLLRPLLKQLGISVMRIIVSYSARSHQRDVL